MFRITAITAATVILAGCGHIESLLRAEPAIHLEIDATSKTEIIVLNTKVTVGCFNGQGALDIDSGPSKSAPATDKNGQCQYASASAKSILDDYELAPVKTGEFVASEDNYQKYQANATYYKELRNLHIGLIMYLSAHNCDKFLSKVFATKGSTDAAKDTLQDVLTGLSAATAPVEPVTSSGLSLLNLVIGKSIENANTTFFMDKTAQTISAAITLDRLSKARELRSRLNATSYAQYNIFQALEDVRHYESACSIKAGLARLQQLVDQPLSEEQNRTAQSPTNAASAAAAADQQLKVANEAMNAALKALNEATTKALAAAIPVSAPESAAVIPPAATASAPERK